jgi:hypothetical protein
MLGMIQNSGNPMAMITQMFGSNPQFNQVMQMIQGKNPKELEQYVRNVYQSNGQDINMIARQFGLKI